MRLGIYESAIKKDFYISIIYTLHNLLQIKKFFLHKNTD